MAIRLGINGFGRIGRTVLRYAVKEKGIDIVAINDLTDAKTLAHLLKYDHVHGSCKGTAEFNARELIVHGRPISILALKNPAGPQWKGYSKDIVLESACHLATRTCIEVHSKTGVDKVVMPDPAAGEDITAVMGVNHTVYNPVKHNIISNASCTTSCLPQVAKVLYDTLDIKTSLTTTIYSNSPPYVAVNMRNMTRMGKKVLRVRSTGECAPRMVSSPLGTQQKGLTWTRNNEKHSSHLPKEPPIVSFGNCYGRYTPLGNGHLKKIILIHGGAVNANSALQ